MIYEFPSIDAPIRQGDIFFGLPRVDVSLGQIPVLEDNNTITESDWRGILVQQEPVAAVVGIRSVAAIVVTQDCDAVRSEDITLCEIRPFREVERKSAQTTAPKSWKIILTQHARINQKWFYLPPDEHVGFVDKMGVDFTVTLSVPRIDLEGFRDLRRGRLNHIADEHFRERLSEFFRRYPYDEWYALNQDELKSYMADYPDIEPFPWQKAGTQE